MASRAFAERVLAWFDEFGRKTLPWQVQTSAYRVWVSEIMLQQTQVQTVIPYYQNFMQQFPNVKQLALADDNDVLSAWSGLGYYARARNLHKTAKQVWHENHGRFPRTRQQLETLPGIGRTTAAAICAISYKQTEAILDGNVKRVLARYFAVPHPIESREGLLALWQRAESLLPKTRIDDYTQAMMDLGAMICVRSDPNCAACPLRRGCQALRQQQVKAFPVRRAKQKKLPHKTTMMAMIIDKDGCLLLERRPSKGIWGGLWCFPTINDTHELAAQFGQARGWHWQSQQSLAAFRHTFTHFHLTISPCLIHLSGRHRVRAPQCWVAPESELPGGIPKPVQQLLTYLETEY